MAAILLVVMLLFRPVFSYQNELVEKPALIFLLDTSSSMSIADDASGVTRFNQARGKLEKWCAKLKDDFRLLPIAFAEQAEVLRGPEELPALKPTGKATSLLRALAAAAKQLPPGRGRRRDPALRRHSQLGRHARRTSPRKMGMAVHCVGVGASLRSNLSYPRHASDRHRLPRPAAAEQRGPGDRLRSMPSDWAAAWCRCTWTRMGGRSPRPS